MTAATSLVGVRDDGGDSYDGLSAAVKTSASGFYVNDLPGVTLQIIEANLLEGQTMSAYLSAVQSSEVLDIVERVVNRSKALINTKELLYNKPVTTGTANYTNRVTQRARFVGYLISPSESSNLKIQITQVGFQSTETQTLKIYLYVTGQKEPLKTADFIITSEKSLIWSTVTDWIMYYDSLFGPGQHYVLGYYESDPENEQSYQLQGEALYQTFDCGCGNSPKKMYGPYASITPIAIDNEYLNFEDDVYNIPQVENWYNHQATITHGLTFKINVTCDITKLITDNITMFARAVQHGMGRRILLDAYSSSEINSVSDSKRDQNLAFANKFLADLEGRTPEGGPQIKGLIDTISLDFSGIDHFCAPCRPGLTMGRLVR